MEETINPLNQIALSRVLYELISSRQEDLVFKTGPVKRLFLDKKHREAVIELRTGETDYALDAGELVMNEVLEAYHREYPEEYEAFMELQKAKPAKPFYTVGIDEILGDENDDEMPN